MSKLTIATASWQHQKMLAHFPNYVFVDTLLDPAFAPPETLLEKQTHMPRNKFTTAYHRTMQISYHSHRTHWEEIINAATNKTLVLGCTCNYGEFCHRDILRAYMGKLAAQMGFTVTQDYEFPDNLLQSGAVL